MVNSSKRVTIFLLALLFLAGNLLNYPFYRFAIHEVKSEMRKEIFGMISGEEKTAAIEMTLSLQEYSQALVEEHELKINGEMYDVVQTGKTADGKIKVTCLHDNKEGLIAAWMKKLTDESSDHSPLSSDKNNKTLKVSDDSDFLPSFYNSVASFKSESEIISFSFNSDGICAGYLNTVKLPPRNC